MRQDGFTLIELLVVMLLLAVLMAGLGNGLSFFTRNTGRAEQAAEDSLTLGRVDRLLRRQLGNALWLGPEQGKGPAVFDGDRNGVHFLFASPSYPTRAGLYAVSIEASSRPGGSRLDYARRLYHVEGAPDERAVLADEAADFAFSYYDGSAWYDQWHGQPGLPKLIRLRVTDPKGGGLVWPEITIRLAAEADFACPDPALFRLCKQWR